MSSIVEDEIEKPVEEERPHQPVIVDQRGDPIPPESIPAKRPLYKRPKFLIAAVLVFLVGAAFALRYWLYARAHESTDDAFIDAHVTPVSPKVSGYVLKVYVDANQQVTKGDLLAEIDPRDFETKLEQAKAALAAGEAKLKEARTGIELTRANTQANVQEAGGTVARARAGVNASRAQAAAERTRISQAGATINAARANVEQARAQLNAANAELARAQADVARYQLLYSKDEVSRQRLDQAIATARTAEAQVDAAQQKVAATLAQVNETQAAQAASAQTARKAQAEVGAAQAQVQEAQGRLAQAQTGRQQIVSSQAQAETAAASLDELRAAVQQAELELSYTKIYAPETGRIAQKTVEQGALVQSGQPLMAVVPGEVWVTANFKENQIGLMQPGQPAEIKVDTYPDKTFKGHVDSIHPGTGSRFSLLPAENATGTYVKVVQRVPVKIVFDEPPDPKHMLVPGMSVEPEVKVR
jgi:membrane fusion protein, multidrug efflux system